MLVKLLMKVGAFRRPGEVLQAVDPQEFKASHPFNHHSVDVDACVLAFFLKSRMSSLVLLLLSCRSVSLHHMARWSSTFHFLSIG